MGVCLAARAKVSFDCSLPLQSWRLARAFERPVVLLRVWTPTPIACDIAVEAFRKGGFVVGVDLRVDRPRDTATYAKRRLTS